MKGQALIFRFVVFLFGYSKLEVFHAQVFPYLNYSCSGSWWNVSFQRASLQFTDTSKVYQFTCHTCIICLSLKKCLYSFFVLFAHFCVHCTCITFKYKYCRLGIIKIYAFTLHNALNALLWLCEFFIHFAKMSYGNSAVWIFFVIQQKKSLAFLDKPVVASSVMYFMYIIFRKRI